MKCKYCDYENPKDAIVCECCGATLATQKSIEFYKKEARKKLKTKPERVKKERPVKEKTVKEKAERVRKPLSVKTVVIAVAVTLVSLILLGVGVFFWRKAYYAPVFEENTSDYAISVYDPESGNVYFLMDGKLVPDSLSSDAKYVKKADYKGVTVFVGTLGEVMGGDVYRQYIVVSEYGVRAIDIPGITDKKNPPSCSFNITEDGKYLIISTSEQIQSPIGGYTLRHRLYFYDIASDTDAALIGDVTADGYIYPVFIGASRLAFSYRDSGGMYQVVVYDCATGERKVIYEDKESVRKLSYTKDASLLTVLSNYQKFYVYTPGDAEATFVTDDYFYHTVSKGGRYIGYTNEKDEAGYIYSLETGEHTFIGNGFVIRSINDDASIIYGYGNGWTESPDMDVYATSLGGEVKNLAAGATNVIFNGDKTECMFIVEDEVYLSQDGDYPVKVKGAVMNISKISGCEDSFVGGIFNVYSGKNDAMICRLNESYELEVLLSDPIFLRGMNLLSEDQKTAFFLSMTTNCVYSCREGAYGDVKLIGAVHHSNVSISPNGRSFYAFSSGSCEWYSNGRGKVISSDAYSVSGFGNGVLIMQPNRGELLPSLRNQTEEEVKNSATGKAYYTYSLYYSEYGKKPALVMDNIAKYTATGTSLYVFALNENSVEGEKPLYDVYGGKSVFELELLISGVECEQ